MRYELEAENIEKTAKLFNVTFEQQPIVLKIEDVGVHTQQQRAHFVDATPVLTEDVQLLLLRYISEFHPNVNHSLPIVFKSIIEIVDKNLIKIEQKIYRVQSLMSISKEGNNQ